MTARTGGAEPADAMRLVTERLREQATRGAELRNRLAELSGRAESEDGLVAVTCTADDPAHDLRIDPRALRLPADDLADLLRRLLRDARTDLTRRTAEALREAGDEAGPLSLVHDPAAAQAKLAQLTELVSGPMRDSTEILERMRRQLTI